MKKIFLAISVVLSLLAISSSSYAKSNVSGGAVIPATAVRFAWAQSDSFFVYCYYQEYNIKTGQVINTYNRYYTKSSFSGCPAR